MCRGQNTCQHTPFGVGITNLGGPSGFGPRSARPKSDSKKYRVCFSETDAVKVKWFSSNPAVLKSPLPGFTKKSRDGDSAALALEKVGAVWDVGLQQGSYCPEADWTMGGTSLHAVRMLQEELAVSERKAIAAEKDRDVARGDLQISGAHLAQLQSQHDTLNANYQSLRQEHINLCLLHGNEAGRANALQSKLASLEAPSPSKLITNRCIRLAADVDNDSELNWPSQNHHAGVCVGVWVCMPLHCHLVVVAHCHCSCCS